MQCRVIILGTTGTTYTFYEIETRKETINEKTKTKEDKSKEDKEEIEGINCHAPPPPAGYVADT